MPELLSDASRVVDPFLHTLDAVSVENLQDDPNYFADDAKSLQTVSNVQSFMTGTGSKIFKEISSLLETTDDELILVTCFWARSSSLDTLNEVLRNLSRKAVRRGTHKIRVSICYSSSSFLQKLFHTQSIKGQTYDATAWEKKLGLPKASELHGLDLRIKSVFILPFSVMHPKFMIIDRKMIILPSCNVSWEEWFEGAVTFTGPIVEHFTRFYAEFWTRTNGSPGRELNEHGPHMSMVNPEAASSSVFDQGRVVKHFQDLTHPAGIVDVKTLFLPSPHRRNPCYRSFARSRHIVAPPTPLNTFLLTLFAKAERNIRIQTPNITSPPVLSSLLRALQRGVDVDILTSARLMILEQLVTAGTTTSRCIRLLIKRYRRLTPTAPRTSFDEEAALQTVRPGNLRISFFEPLHGQRRRGQENGEPQQSHLKMTVVDGEVLVLGSGNLDRASWFTSQELGVAFFSKELVDGVTTTVDEAMKGRSRLVYDSTL